MRLWLSGLVPLVYALTLPIAARCGDDGHSSYPPNATAELPSWLPGVWSREWIEERGVRSSTFDVHYLQTPTFFGDVRLPLDRPKFPHAASFRDLTDEELRALAQQRGFTGRTTMAGAIATWHHEIDFQPPDGIDDVDRLERIAVERMHENGLDGSYTESWRSISDGEERFLVIRTERAGRPARILLAAGDHFLYVRNRPNDLPEADSLDVLIAASRASRAQIIRYLDCEFSAGRVRNGSIPWEIQHSTLPWREGHHLDFVDEISLSGGADGVGPRRPGAERWTVPIDTLAPGELTSTRNAPVAHRVSGRPCGYAAKRDFGKSTQWYSSTAFASARTVETATY